MKLVIITALIAVCSTAKLDRTYLPPPSAGTAGGTADSLQTPLIKSSSNQGLEPQSTAPLGSYTNEFQGVVVDAAAPGTRASFDSDLSGLGAPRPSYGSTDSKVGEAAFRGSVYNGQAGVENGETKPERPQAFRDRNSNILSYSNDVNPDAYSYGFETDNGIAVGENGIDANGIQAQGGYSYQGDDGQVYKVTYVADEGGYRPQGDHLPTPHPIPEEILKSLEQNAKEEAAGIVDDGSYDAQKYNGNGDYTAHNGGNTQHNGAQLSQFSKRPEDASASGSFINQNNQPFGKPVQNTNGPANVANQLGSYQDQRLTASQIIQNQGTLAGSHKNGQFAHHSGSQASQFGHSQNFDNHASQFEAQIQNTQSTSGAQFGSPSQFGFGAQAGRPVQPSFGLNPINSGPNQQIGNNAFKPQGPSGSFGKPTQFVQQSQYSQSNQYNYQGTKKPIGSLNNNQRPAGQNQLNNFESASSNKYNNIPQASNQYETNNEYLPPKNDFGSQPQLNGAANTFNSATQELSQNRPSQIHFNQVHGFQGTAGPVTTQSNSNFNNKPDNFPSQSQNVPSKFSQNLNSQSFGQKPFNSQPTKPFGSSNLKPTSIPDTELTTPLEPNETSPSNPQFDGQTTVSFGSFNNKPSSQFSQTQQFNSQNIIGSKQPQMTPTLPTSQSLTSGQNNGFPSGVLPQNNQRPQFLQNTFNQNQFTQQSDDAYYYKQPTKPFNIPQDSRFPSSPSYQSNVGFVQNSQFNNQQVSSSKVPSSQASPAPSLPTSSSQFGQVQGSLSSNFNSITQAAISPFPSASPTPSSSQFGKPQNNQFGSKPTFTQTSFEQQSTAITPSNSVPTRPQFNQPTVIQTETTEQTSVSQTDATKQPEVENQQYSGTIYEYNKPAQTLPAQSDSDSSQSIQSNNSSPKPLQDEPINESSSPQKDSKPQSSFQANQFSQNSFTQTQQSQPIQGNSRPQFGSQTSGNAPSQFSQSTQSFNSLSSSQQQLQKPKPTALSSTQSNFGQVTQQYQGSSGLSSQQNQVPQNNLHFGNTEVTGYPSHEESKPQFGPAFPTNSQFLNPQRQPALGLNYQPQGLPSTGPSQFNSKPQFGAQNQFIQNTQTSEFAGSASSPIQPQFGSNSYGQQTVFGQNQNVPFTRPMNQFGQSTAQAFTAVSQNHPNNPHIQSIPNKVSQFNQNQQVSGNFNQVDSQGSGSSQIISDEPVKAEQPSQFGSQFSGFQATQNLQGFAPKGEEFEGPRQPPSFNDKTGYHY